MSLSKRGLLEFRSFDVALGATVASARDRSVSLLRRALVAAFVVNAFCVFGCLATRASEPTSGDEPKAATVASDADDFKPPPGLHDGWYARIETDKGRIIARLLPEQAPQSVAHFAALAMGEFTWTDVVTGEKHREPYYDGVPIHLAEAGMRFEAGDRGGTGRTPPLIWIPLEGQRPVTFHVPAALGMTSSGGERISGVQFFVTAAAQPWLSSRHPLFGVVVEGRDVVRAISEVKTYSNGRPIDPVLIEKVRIFSVGDVEALPTPREFTPTRTSLQEAAQRPEDKAKPQPER